MEVLIAGVSGVTNPQLAEYCPAEKYGTAPCRAAAQLACGSCGDDTR